MDSRQQVKSLKKALRALTFMNQRGDATVTEVAKAIGVPRPTSYRILETLASEGYVEKQPHSGFYRITSLVKRLAAGFQNEELLIEVSKPVIHALGQELGWPITLSTPRCNEMVVRLNTDYDSALALERYHIGFAAPILNLTSGYCFLAYCPESERDHILTLALQEEASSTNSDGLAESRYLAITKHVNHLTRFNKNSRAEIEHLIKTVRDRGFCNIEFAQYREGNVGVPLFIGGRAVGGIVMRYIKSVLKNTDRIHNFYVPKLQQIAQTISDAYIAHLDHLDNVDSPSTPRPATAILYPKFG